MKATNKKSFNLDDVNSYFKELIRNRIDDLPEKLKDVMIRQSKAMTSIGVTCPNDHKIFMYSLLHAPVIARDLSGVEFSPARRAKISSLVYKNRDKYPINTISKFHKAVANSLNELNIPIKKTAYPQGGFGGYIASPYNLQKWVSSMQGLRMLLQQGHSFNDSFKKVTAHWDDMEIKDFKYWMSFYDEGAQLKYKTANNYDYLMVGDGTAGIPLQHLGPQRPQRVDNSNLNSFKPEERLEAELDVKVETQAQTEAQKTAELRKKVISRFNSIRKLLQEGPATNYLGEDCTKKLLDGINSLSTYFTTCGKNKNASLFDDLIIKQANCFKRDGLVKESIFFKFLAESDFFRSSDDNVLDNFVKFASKQENEEERNFDGSDIIVVEGQEAVLPTPTPAPTPAPTPTPTPAPVEAVEVSEDDLEEPADVAADEVVEVSEQSNGGDKDFDLENVTIEDVIAKLEALSNLYKNREISRQLSLVDLMMDKLGIASFFPALSEATRSSLESNQYGLSRIEGILSRLRGSIEVPQEDVIDLEIDVEDSEADKVDPAAVQANLERAEQKKRQDNQEKSQDSLPKSPEADLQEIEEPVTVAPVPQQLKSTR